MSRSARRAAARKRNARQPLGIAWNAIAAGIPLSENPNRGKHAHAARLADPQCDERAIRSAERDYRPLTVSSPLTRAPFPKRASDRSSYTV